MLLEALESFGSFTMLSKSFQKHWTTFKASKSF